MSLLQKQGYVIAAKGELVVVAIASFSCTLEFQDAIGLSAMIRREARYAKASSGDRSRLHSSIGILSDAAAQKWRQARWRKLPEQLKLKKLFVRHAGAMVTINIGRQGMTMPYNAAFEIAQQLRVYGKLARNHANEKAGWQRINELATPVTEH